MDKNFIKNLDVIPVVDPGTNSDHYIVTAVVLVDTAGLASTSAPISFYLG